MTEAITARLGSRFERYSVESRLHDVPPHEVYACTADGRRAVCKRSTGPTGTAATEGRVVELVAAETAVAVPEVLAVGVDFFVAAHHPEAPAPDGEFGVDDAWARAAGRGLATLHADTDGLFDGFGPPEIDGDSVAVDGAGEFHEAACAYLRTRRDIVAQFGHAGAVATALDALEEHPDCFAGAGGPVLCHGWWTPEHVAVADGRVACALDFEHAVAAPAEFDYWRAVVPRPDMDENRRAAFRAGYESVRSLPDALQRRRPFYLLLIFAYYFESLYVQDQHPPSTTEQKATALADRVDELVADLD